MDRRATLATLLGRSTTEEPTAVDAFTLSPPPSAGLAPYAGKWEFAQAAHLLRRATFGPSYAQINDVVKQGMKATVDQLLKVNPLPSPPINLDYTTDPQVPVGSTWIDAPYSRDANNQVTHINYRANSLAAWTLDNVLNEGISVREKMTLFWHNHFATNQQDDPKFNYAYMNTLRANALGNFKDLVKKITVDPNMLRFLNGNQNTRTAPNENFARELLELFTIGKGVQAGPGDYTNYTETDIKEIAKALTGWRDQGYRSTDPAVKMSAVFRPTSHDTTTKKLSARFGGVEIPNGNEKEYETVVDIIFTKAEVARYISRKLYRWFVYYKISAAAETEVIEPLAKILIDNKFEIIPALRALLSSQHFFDSLNLGPMIKNPIDFSLGLIKQVGLNWPAVQATKYSYLNNLFRTVAQQQMIYFNPPDVAGWKAYYQEPAYYRIWINATTLNNRMIYTNRLSNAGLNIGATVRLNVLDFVKSLSKPSDPNVLISDMVKVLLPQGLTDAQMAILNDTLLGQLPDYEWTVEYNQYLAKPDDAKLKGAIEGKLRTLLQAILAMPEFYLS
jgi:uncharacterized protein (DUF1800 family)